ncbi:DUF255 domain-containing protein [Siphonobacter sp. SORGH_AS_0500]|uniref:thioredoxin family protein n=1 Tax=Siphonobacter sp. SORGH_AS_0500 TaxID=1864824 RepID=UPI001E59AA7C|nr:DUF255 domain-containing protein [Siphonobacter sp. SORGH_AS_0500]MDR6196517.1 thioredoxin-related protein [Siphonobacter sp. SORGH_AS_0500]
MRSILTFCCMLALSVAGWSFAPIQEKPQSPKAAKIEWLTIEEAYARNQKEPRKFMIDVYTDWCGWCKVMDRETFTNPKVVEYVNQKYYAVKLDAEGKNPIKLGSHTFNYIAQGNRGYQELAALLMNGKMSFPTVVFMDETFVQNNELQVIQAVPGFHKAPDFHQIITFFGDNYHKKQTPWEKYKSEIYPKAFTR